MGIDRNSVPDISQLIDRTGLPYEELREHVLTPWELLRTLKDFFDGFQYRIFGTVTDGAFVDDRVTIGEGSVIEPTAVIVGPALIGRNCRIRAGAYIRDHVIIGDNCVIGHSSEVKNSIFFTGVQIAHFNYVGDSIMGNRSHLAAGAKIANVRISGGPVRIRTEEQTIDTGLSKFGAILGDDAEVGCNAVLNPGSILGRKSIVYPLVNWRGVLAENMIAKSATECILRK